MDSNSPFAGRDVPIIGQPKILNVVAISLLQCNCEDKPLMMGPIGPAPFVCQACSKAWLVQAQVQVAVTQIIRQEEKPVIES